MSRDVLPNDVLKKLRKLGDPSLDDWTLVDPDAVAPEFDVLRRRTDLLPETLNPEPEKLFLAQRLFGDYTAEISGALLLAALPQSYATEYGAAVLGARGELENNLTRRIGHTAQFLLTVMQPGANTADDQSRLWDWKASEKASLESVEYLPWAACVRLRIYHQLVRNQLVAASADERIKHLLGTENDPPLNQEDLLGMLLTFSFSVFEVLDRFGISWTADEQEAYLHLWDVIGGYLAIGSDPVRDALNQKKKLWWWWWWCMPEDDAAAGSPAAKGAPERFEVPLDWHGLRPPTIEQSRALLEQIRQRQWLDPTPKANVTAMSWTALRSGRVLARALLDELEEGMPPLLKPLPIAVMRAINPDVVIRRLNLGGNGVLLQSLTLLPKREMKVARFTSVRTPNKLAGRVLRTLANEVTVRASVHLNQKYDFKVPGAPDWHRTP